MPNNFNLEPYIELALKKELTQIESKELRSYGAMIERQISYNRREEYFSLISDYLAKKIHFGVFSGKFLKLEKEDGDTSDNFRKVLNQLSDLSIDPDIKNGSLSSLVHFRV